MSSNKRKDAMQAMHQLLHDEVHAFFLWKRDTKSAWSNAIRNNSIAPGVFYTDADGWRVD